MERCVFVKLDSFTFFYRGLNGFVSAAIAFNILHISQRLVTLYDPTNPVLRPKLIHCKVRHRTTSCNSQSSQCDSSDITDNIVSIKLLRAMHKIFAYIRETNSINIKLLI